MTGKKFIVHAGNLKTGSTAIQRVLRANLAEVEATCDLAVPGLELSPSMHAALCTVSQRHVLQDKFNWGNLKDWIAPKTQSSILLTSEVYIRMDAKALKSRLMTLNPESITVHFYLPPHTKMLTSSVAQEYKTGYFWVDLKEGAERLIPSRQIDFIPVMQEYMDVFGPSNVKIRDYTRSLFPDGDVVQDFGDFIGHPGISRIAASMDNSEFNVTPGAEELAVLHWVRRIAPEDGFSTLPVWAPRDVFGPLATRMTRTIPRDRTTRFVLPLAIQETMKERFEAGRVAFSNAIEGFRASPEWLSETIQAPLPPKNLPAEPVRAALRQIRNNLAKEGHALLQLVDTALKTLPTTLDGGEKVIPIADLPFLA